MLGLSVGLGAVMSSAAYTVWISKLKKELDVSSMQLLNEYAPMAVLLLVGCTLSFENVGWIKGGEDSLLGYKYNFLSVSVIVLSACMGLLVSLSTFLFIGATSALTYNVVGHLKTLFIVGGGVIIFGEEITLKKALGIAVAMGGIVWYNELKKQESQQAQQNKKLIENGGLSQHKTSNGGEMNGQSVYLRNGETADKYHRKPSADGGQIVYDLKRGPYGAQNA
eukprot:TRINITY_DN10374_c0_g6_i1.p1 TRINITY_DN10374_c0_g6~~TRINITY_DN10374_c0_g6_i1.p1  ORF type:complete len:230 (+),score=19.27 TRINITY_DN10374_c0_g6_i1:24-692(+)